MSADSGFRLKKLRVSKGFTQSYLCSKTGINLRTYQGYECGRRSIDNMSFCSFLCLADFFGMSLDDLYFYLFK